MTYKIEKTDAQWKALLAEKGAEPMAFDVTRHEATERAHTGKLSALKAEGVYKCICCDKPLFEASAKYESGTGWPSYFQPISADAVGTKVDGMLTAVPTWATCLKTGLRPLACATA